MQTILLILHVLFALAIVGLVLIQRGEGGGLGLGGGGNMQGLMSARGTASMMTRATAVAAALFFVSSLALSILVADHDDGGSIVDDMEIETPAGGEPVDDTPVVPTSE